MFGVVTDKLLLLWTIL